MYLWQETQKPNQEKPKRKKREQIIKQNLKQEQTRYQLIHKRNDKENLESLTDNELPAR